MNKFQGKSVLIVDDSVQMQRLVRQLLEAAGISDTILAGNGFEAFDHVRRRSFDLIIADWLMPEMDGLTFISKLRADKSKPYADTPVVMLTGMSTAADVKTAVASGINGYVVKPCSPKSLLAQVEKVIH